MASQRASYGRLSGTLLLVAVPGAGCISLVLASAMNGLEEGLVMLIGLAAFAALFAFMLWLISLPVEVSIEEGGIRILPQRGVSIYPGVGRLVPWSEIREVRISRTQEESTAQPAIARTLDVDTVRGVFMLSSSSPAQLEEWAAAIHGFLPDRGGATALHSIRGAGRWIRPLAWSLVAMLALVTAAGVLQLAGVMKNENPFPWLRIIPLWMAAIYGLMLSRPKRVRGDSDRP